MHHEKTERAFLNKLVKIRRTIHRHPELGTEEYRTAAFIERTLAGAGIKTKRMAGTGVIGLLEGKRPSGKEPLKTFALRADMDALPVQEMTGKPYASARPGVMHACGHDANTTIVLGAAILLASRREEFSGNVKFIFQPNEESSGGAISLLEAGVLKKPDVDAIVGIHVSPWLAPGTLGLKSGEMMAAVDRFTIEIQGAGGHGAYPHLAKDAIVAAAQVVTAFQTIVSRDVDPVDPAVVTIGAIHGGERYNIICDKVTMVGTVRTLNGGARKKIRATMEHKLRNVAEAFAARYSLTYEELGSPLVNSPEILELCREAGTALLGQGKVRVLAKPSMGGEDFAEYLQYVPGCFLYFGTAVEKSYPWHHEKFDVNEEALPRGAELLAAIAKRFLNKS